VRRGAQRGEVGVREQPLPVGQAPLEAGLDPPPGARLIAGEAPRRGGEEGAVGEGGVEREDPFELLGGLAVAVSECAVNSKRLGASLDLQDDIPLDALLFGETQSRILISYPANDKANLDVLKELCVSYDIPLTEIGEVTADRKIVIRVKGKTLIDAGIDDAVKSYNTRYIEEW